ncbi:hypothetical protein BJX68DRAFT_270023 [Aspergillus pseudodeflectus]|uniref:DNA 3'-5' helicase n=1 Tax=Aspergillus pseudodeflectus TaxID=176178 RepID=A0ABR4JU00_9EURO
MDMTTAMQQMTGQACMQFRGVQGPAMAAIQQGHSPVVAIMPTGGGKSMLFMLPVWAVPGGTTIVVVPLILLRQDMARRCRQVGVSCVAWDRQRPPDEAAIVLVTPESAVTSDFQSFINRRRNLAYRVWWPAVASPYQWQQDPSIIAFIQARIQQARQAGGGKVVMYASAVRQVQAMAEIFGCEAYHSRQVDRAGVLERFIQGTTDVIVATNALGMGVDIPDIRVIIHIGMPRTLLDYVQESGRARWDGQASEAIIIQPEGMDAEGGGGVGGHHAREQAEDEEVDQDVEAQRVQRYMHVGGCRWVVLDEYLDGIIDGYLTIGCLEKQLICYWERVVEQGHLCDSLFKPSAAQLEAWEEVTWLAAQLLMPTPTLPTTPRQRHRHGSSSSSSSSSSDHTKGNRDRDADKNVDVDGDAAFKAHTARLDHAVLAFCMVIIQYPLPYRVFDSVLVLYAVVRFWSTSEASWLAIGNYSSILSQLIYDCQLMVLAHVIQELGKDAQGQVRDHIITIWDEWLLNDTQGPVRELLDNRLLAFHIAKSEVPPAQLRWHPNGETLWPACYLLPEVAQLVTQYLTIIQPFRHFLQDQAQIPNDGVGDYLWAGSAAPWTKDTLTQIIIGIARRKLTPAEANLLIKATEEREGEDREGDAITPVGSMLNALGTVNFRGGLTDAGLQEYRHVSMLWHCLIQDPLHFTMTGATPTLVSRPRGTDEAGLDLDHLHGPTPWEWDTPTPTRRRGAGAGGARMDRDADPVQPLAITPAKRPWVQQ